MMNLTCLWINSTVNYKLPDGWREFSFVFYIGACLLSVVGNSLVLLTIWRRPLLHRTCYYFVASLAFEDLLQITTIATIIPQAHIYGCWMLGAPACVAYGYISSCMACVEFLLLSDITVDRYFACCKPLRYSIYVTPGRCKWAISGCWIYSAIITSLPLFGFSSYPYVPHLSMCQLDFLTSPVSRGYVCILNGTIFVPCFVVIVVSQILIYKQAKKVADQPLPQISHSSAIVMVSSRNNKATITVSLVTGICFLTWMPYLGICFSKFFIDGYQNDEGSQIMIGLERASLCFFTVSKFANPIIYGVYNREFRRECLAVFRRGH